jgi:hypothetical protein
LFFSLRPPFSWQQLLTEAAETTDGEPGPTARAIKERIAKIRDLAKRAAGAAPDCETPSPSSKRGRGKKGNTSKNTTSSTSTSTPRKRKRKNADAEVEQQSDDKATAEAQLNELLDYPNETPNADHGYMSPGNPVLSDDDA